jgi:hypothetical protein
MTLWFLKTGIFFHLVAFPGKAEKLPVFARILPMKKRLWLGAESNRRHVDFQSTALPTELPSRDTADLWRRGVFTMPQCSCRASAALAILARQATRLPYNHFCAPQAPHSIKFPKSAAMPLCPVDFQLQSAT